METIYSPIVTLIEWFKDWWTGCAVKSANKPGVLHLSGDSFNDRMKHRHHLHRRDSRMISRKPFIDGLFDKYNHEDPGILACAIDALERQPISDPERAEAYLRTKLRNLKNPGEKHVSFDPNIALPRIFERDDQKRYITCALGVNWEKTLANNKKEAQRIAHYRNLSDRERHILKSNGQLLNDLWKFTLKRYGVDESIRGGKTRSLRMERKIFNYFNAGVNNSRFPLDEYDLGYLKSLISADIKRLNNRMVDECNRLFTRQYGTVNKIPIGYPREIFTDIQKFKNNSESLPTIPQEQEIFSFLAPIQDKELGKEVPDKNNTRQKSAKTSTLA